MHIDPSDLRTIAPGPELLSAVRGLLIVQGTNLTAWCRDNHISRPFAILALTGKRNGPAARELRRRLITEASRAAA